MPNHTGTAGYFRPHVRTCRDAGTKPLFERDNVFYRVRKCGTHSAHCELKIWQILRPKPIFLPSSTDRRKSVTSRPFPESSQDRTRPRSVQIRYRPESFRIRAKSTGSNSPASRSKPMQASSSTSWVQSGRTSQYRASADQPLSFSCRLLF